jgi:tetratricopeptide (TPR) repeat protein
MNATPTPAEAAPAATLKKHRLWQPMGFHYHLVVILTLGTLILMAYANSFQTGFALDNKFIILEDPRLRDAKKDNIRLVFTQDYWWPKAVSGLYRPLTTLSYLFNYAILKNGENSTGYHWINFLLHWANGVLLYFLVLHIMGNMWPAVLTSLVWLVHPVNVESVTNIVGRADLLATVCVLGGLLCYIKSTAMAGWQRVVPLVISSLLLGIGIFCKESAIVLVPLAALYDVTYRWRSSGGGWMKTFGQNVGSFFLRGYVVFVPTLLFWAYVHSKVFEALRPPELPFVDNPMVRFWDNSGPNNPRSILDVLVNTAKGQAHWGEIIKAWLTASKVFLNYLVLLVWPAKLSCDYSYNQIPLFAWQFGQWETWRAFLGAGALIAILIAAFRNYSKHKPMFFFTLFGLGAFLPTSNFLRVIGSIMAERFLYLPSIGFCAVFVLGVYAICRRVVHRFDFGDSSRAAWKQRLWLQASARTMLCLVIAAFGARTFMRNFAWTDDLTLWRAAVKVCPNSFKTHKSLAYAMYEQLGSPQNPDITIDGIIEVGERALAITRETQIVLLHLGAYYRMKGDSLAHRTPDGALIAGPEALEWYRKSAAILAEAVPLDQAFNEDNRQKELRRGRRPEQIPDIGNHEIYLNLGMSLIRLGDPAGAVQAYAYMRHLSPANPDSYASIASAQLMMDLREDAIVSLLQTLLLDSSRQEELRVLVNLYQQIDQTGCAIVYQMGIPKLNADCPIVRDHLKLAYLGLVATFAQSKQYDLARQTKNLAVETYGFPREEFDRIIN